MIKLYNTPDLNNVINKRLTEMKSFNIRMKDSTNVVTPVIKLRLTKDFNLIDSNYAYIDEFERYYFITEFELVSDDIYNVYMDCDVLETYKDDILNGTGLIRKEIKEGIYTPVSSSDDVRKTSEIYENEETVLTEGTTLILSTIGG